MIYRDRKSYGVESVLSVFTGERGRIIVFCIVSFMVFTSYFYTLDRITVVIGNLT